MTSAEKVITFIPTSQRRPPPTKFLGQEDGRDVYRWYITEDEYLRLNKLFGHDFQEVNLGATLVEGLPHPCTGCGKYTEFIDWVWTALQRGVHSTEFMFRALKDSHQGKETAHDVYCSECGTLTAAQRATSDAEGGAADIFLAGNLNRSSYTTTTADSDSKVISAKEKESNPSKQVVVWGKWWLDDNGSTEKYRASRQSAM